MNLEDFLVIIPAYNEEKTIGNLITRIKKQGFSILVIDDGSIDDTSIIAETHGAKVIKHRRNQGYVSALRTGFSFGDAKTLITIDADGEHDPKELRPLVSLYRKKNVHILYGKRKVFRDWTEKIISSISFPFTGIRDSSTGFRIIDGNIAKKMYLYGYCTCGTFMMEAKYLGVTQSESEISYRYRQRRRMDPKHFKQIFFIVSWIFSAFINRESNFLVHQQKR